jgi:hypothetical protein
MGTFMGNGKGIFLFFLLVNACDRAEPPHPRRKLPDLSSSAVSPEDLVVAKVNGTPIFASEVSRQAAITKMTPRDALDTLIAVEALVHTAKTKRIAQGDEAEEGWKQILAQAWIVKDLEPQLDADQIPESLIREVYDRSRGAFDHGRLVRIATLDLYAFSTNGPIRRQQARQWAQELSLDLQKMKQKPTPAELQRLAGTEKWTARGLKAGMTWQSDTQPYSVKVGQAALALRDWGEVSPVVEDNAGFHIVMHQGERAELRQTFDEAKATIREGITAAWQQRRFNEILTDLATKAKVVVTPEVLVSQTLK